MSYRCGCACVDVCACVLCVDVCACVLCVDVHVWMWGGPCVWVCVGHYNCFAGSPNEIKVLFLTQLFFMSKLGLEEWQVEK